MPTSDFPSRVLRVVRATASFALALSLIACGGGNGDGPPDGGADAATDGGGVDSGPIATGQCFRIDRPGALVELSLRWGSPSTGMIVGTSRPMRLSLGNDTCFDAEISIAAADPSVVGVPGTVSLPGGSTRTEVTFEGLAVGSTTVSATWVITPPASAWEGFELPDDVPGEVLTDDEGNPVSVRHTAEIEVAVVADEQLSCDGDASGNLAPGGEVVMTGADTAGAGVSLPEGAARDDQFHVDPFDVTVACAPDQVPEGFRALGPAITVGPGHLRFLRELPLAIPIRSALMHAQAKLGHIRVSYTGPGVPEPRIVPVASPWVDGSPERGLLRFQTPRLGTYQAVIDPNEPRERERTFTFRGITGVSMGGGGAGLIGLNNPDKFDLVAPLGGPVDWVSLLEYIRVYHLGGFCTEEQRASGDATCDDGALTSRTPPSVQPYEFVQNFESWFYEDENDGQGGTFDRHEYIQIFRDLAMMYGNLNTTRTTDPAMPNITPPGVPDSRRAMSDAERCATPLIIPPYDGSDPTTGYFDDEYNPEGQYQAITFCDGAEVRIDGDRDVGLWDPDGAHFYPVEVALAIDIDGDGVRDAGEPVVRNGREHYEDCGMDRLCNEDEPGYDPVTNPDPAGDDYDFQFNPNGTEGNWLREGDRCDPASGEAFEDTGLDGVFGTAQLADGGYDHGEADGCWTVSGGMERMLAVNPRARILEEEDGGRIFDLDILSDGGIRDLFNFAVIHNHFIGAFAARNRPVSLYNSHAALSFDGTTGDADFKFAETDWSSIGKYVHIRYGDPDTTPGLLQQGDGGHVGTPTQAVNRILSAIAWISSKWPNGDRRRVTDRICPEVNDACPVRNQFTFDFTSPTTSRTGPVTVILPPGYSQPEFEDVDFPVVYFGHGYGQDPTDLVAIGIILWNFMTGPRLAEADRLQKMIFVFPDGRCRGDECIKGTFYADAPQGTPGGAQMETFMLDLMDHMDANFRTRAPETHTVIE